MLVLRGADLLLYDRIVRDGSLVVEDAFITDIVDHRIAPPAGAEVVELGGHLVVPGFVDMHVHGVAGHDVLDGPAGVGEVASRLPAFGVTSFCPTAVACPPGALEELLAATERAQAERRAVDARVIGAHLESNFVNREYAGAQPIECLRAPTAERKAGGTGPAFSGHDILDVIARHRGAARIVTLAPELPGVLELVEPLSRDGHVVSLGHSSASYEIGRAAFDAGARHATHLFNRMPPLHHRAPGLAGAALDDPRVAVEIVGDGYHVHPMLLRAAVALKTADRTVAITDGTAGSGLPVGSQARLGGRTIEVREHACFLPDGTLAGSSQTMDGVFRLLIGRVGLSEVEAARVCASTPTRQLGRDETGRLAPGLLADLTVLDGSRRVVRTYIDGALAFAANSPKIG